MAAASIPIADPSSHAAPRSPPGPLAVWGPLLPADSLAQLRGRALVLALLEQALERRHHDHEQGEEDDHAERAEGDGLVVGLSGQPLAVVRGERRSRQLEGQEEGCQAGSHGERNDTLCPRWRTTPSSASWRSRRGAGTSTNGTTSATPWSSTASSSPRSSIPPTTASSPTP